MLNKNSKPYYYETYHHLIFWNKKHKKGFEGIAQGCTSKKKKVENKLFGQQAMMYDAILKQVWENYLIIVFINNQFLTSICLSIGFITSKNTARQRLAS